MYVRNDRNYGSFAVCTDPFDRNTDEQHRIFMRFEREAVVFGGTESMGDQPDIHFGHMLPGRKVCAGRSLNKYVKLVCGLVVAIVIAGPVIRFLGGDIRIQEVAWNDYVTMSKGEMERRIQRLEEEDARQLLEIYRQSLISDVKYRYQGERDFIVIGQTWFCRKTVGAVTMVP